MDSFAGTFLALLVLATNNLPTGQWIMDRDVCVCVCLLRYCCLLLARLVKRFISLDFAENIFAAEQQ